jgi:hypothetical protein
MTLQPQLRAIAARQKLSRVVQQQVMAPYPMIEQFVMQPPNQSVERTGRKRPSAHFQR